jgi:hypothetical protein
LFFRLQISKLAAANFILTLILISLGISMLRLSPAIPPPQPESVISLTGSKEIIPFYHTIKTEELTTVFDQYRAQVLKKSLVPQADYVNLAILAQEVGQNELAQEYWQTAQNINPNRDFFVYPTP